MKQKIKLTENKLYNIVSEAITATLDKIKNDTYNDYTTVLDNFILLNGKIQRYLIIGDYETVLDAFYSRFTNIDPENEKCDYNDLYNYLENEAHPSWGKYN